MPDTTDTIEPSAVGDQWVGRVLSGKYRVRRVLGTGGMGSVLEVEHVITQRVGALKLLHASFSGVPEVIERFTREASAAGRIGNDRIVQTFDAGRLEEGPPYIFMELLSGLTLERLLKERGPLRFDEAAAIALQAAEGLAAAHAAGIVHRDIKPANLFLVDRGQMVKILDFGISKFDARTGVSPLTAAGTAMGTPHYMPPEQIVGKATDERADIYALGVVLYECVVGAPPYRADTLAALAVRVHEGRYTPVSALRSDTPPGFDALLARCLALEPAQRFGSASQLIAGLSELFGSNAAALMPTAYGSSFPPPGQPLAPRARGTGARTGPSVSLDVATVPPPTSAAEPLLEGSALLNSRRVSRPAFAPERGGRVGVGPLLAGLALGLGLLGLVGWWLFWPRAPAPLATSQTSASDGMNEVTPNPTPIAAVATQSLGPSESQSADNHVEPSSTTLIPHPPAQPPDPIGPAPKAAPERGAPRVQSTPPRVTSKARDDGLQEQNPYAE